MFARAAEAEASVKEVVDTLEMKGLQRPPDPVCIKVR